MKRSESRKKTAPLTGSSAELASSAPPEALEIGLAWLDAVGEGASRKAAARKLVRQAIEGVDTDRLPVRCLLLLATVDWCNEPRASLPREIRRETKKTLGYDVPLIGGSMASLFCLAEESHFIDHGLILVALCSNDLWVTVTSMTSPHGTSEGKRRQRLKKVAEVLQERAGTRLGASAARHLLAFSPGIFLNKRGEQVYLDNELHEEIVAAFGYRHRVVGGAAADSLTPTVGYQFADDKCLKSGLALAMVETDLAWGTVLGHGFAPNRRVSVTVDRLVRDADIGYDVAVLDGKPARERWSELQQEHAGSMSRVLLGAPTAPDCRVICDIREGDASGDHIRLNRQVRPGDQLFLLETSSEQLEESAREVTHDAVEASGTPVSSLKFMFHLTCTGRVALYGEYGRDWREIAVSLNREFENVPMVGGLCAGEFGVDRWRRAHSNNFSFWVSCLASSHATHAVTRDLQSKLLAAADRLSRCQTPKDVMTAALEGACEAGTSVTGGQVCVVDYTIGRILGLGLGCAFSLPDAGHDWSKLAALTDRPIAADQNRDFPRYLLNWSQPIDQRSDLRVVTSVPREEDILTLIVRTGRAVFVPDTSDRMFHCARYAADEGHIVTFLAIPLLGSKGEAIATLQIGFPEHSPMDRESFGHWIGYSQKIAAALERAQEAEERSIVQEISSIGNAIMQTPPDLNVPPDAWCVEYLGNIVRWLGADGGHIRLLEMGPDGEAFRLVAAVGPLAKLRMETRPVTRTGQGSYDLKLLQSGFHIIRQTQQEMRDLNTHVQAIDNVAQYGEAFKAGLDALQSTALFPLKHEDLLLGSFVIEGNQPYCFTDRKARLVSVAAETAGAILRGRIDAYDRLALETEKIWLVENLARAKEDASSLELDELLSRLCKAAGADVASLYLWCEPAHKLILHTSFNWFKNMEGKAAYGLGEGWTGRVATEGDQICMVGHGDSELHRLTHKYYSQMIPPEHRVPEGGPDSRIGVRLQVGGKLVGLAMFSYFWTNLDQLLDRNRRARVMSFLVSVTDYLTLAVEDMKAETAQKQRQRLVETKERVAQHLIQASGPELHLQQAVDAIRDGLRVQCVEFHPVPHVENRNRLSFLRQSYASPLGCSINSLTPDSISDLLDHTTEAHFTVATAEQLRDWPGPQGLGSLSAVRVTDVKGEAKGILVLTNRIPTKDHPFESLDDSEQQAARDLARTIGAAIDHHEHELREAEEQESRAAYDRMQAELELNREKAESEKAMRDAFEDVAHQIKSPLGEAARRVEASAERFSQTAAGRHFRAIAAPLHRAELTAKLIGLFANLAKGGELAVKGIPQTPSDLVRMVGQVCENQRLRISPKRNIRIHFSADSFYKHAPAELNADPDLFLQALSNLVDNAVKYSYSNTTISVFGARSKRGGFFIAVTNKGIPIAPGEEFLVRQRNWRGERAKASVGEGNGLGLWIVDHIAKAHAGQLQVLPTRPTDGITEIRLAFPWAK